MSPIRKITLFLSGFLLRFLLFFGFSLLALTLLLSNPDSVKNALVNANAYDRFIKSYIESGKQQSANNTATIPFDDPEVQKIITSSFPSTTLLKLSEGTIDTTYQWLNGDKSKLSFSFDLTQNKDTLARSLSGYAVERASQLPPCKEIPTVQNIFRLDCLPPYVDLSEQRAAMYQSIANDQSFLADPVLTEQNLPTKNGKKFVDVYAQGPQYFKLFRIAPYILLLLAAGAAVVTVFASRTKRQGIKRVGASLLGSGVVLMISPLIATFITPSINKALQSGFGGSTQTTTAIVNDINNNLYAELNGLLINVALQVMAVGIIILMALRYFRNDKLYAELERKSGVASSVGKPPSSTKGMKQASVPVQSSEDGYKVRTPTKTKKKYRKIGM